MSLKFYYSIPWYVCILTIMNLKNQEQNVCFFYILYSIYLDMFIDDAVIFSPESLYDGAIIHPSS